MLGSPEEFFNGTTSMGAGFFLDETYVFAYDSVSIDGVDAILLDNSKSLQAIVAENLKNESQAYGEQWALPDTLWNSFNKFYHISVQQIDPSFDQTLCLRSHQTGIESNLHLNNDEYLTSTSFSISK